MDETPWFNVHITKNTRGWKAVLTVADGEWGAPSTQIIARTGHVAQGVSQQDMVEAVRNAVIVLLRDGVSETPPLW